VGLWQKFKYLLDPARSVADDTFSLGNRRHEPAAERELTVQRISRAGVEAGAVVDHIDSLLVASSKSLDKVKESGDLSDSLETNRKRLESLFRMPANKDMVIREFEIATDPPAKAILCFVEGLSDRVAINDNILQPLMLLSRLNPTDVSIKRVLERLLPGNQAKETFLLQDVAADLLAGDSVLIIEGLRTAITIETKGPPGRSVSEPKVEQVVWGAQDGFTEGWRTNVALIRRRLKDPRLVTEVLQVGEIGQTYVGILYIDGLVQPKLVAEIKRRIKAVKVDAISGGGTLAQFIVDNPGSFLPGVLMTERPDRTAGYLTEAHVAIMVDNSPHAIICPVSLWALLQTAEDYYLDHPFATFLRYIRLVALLISVLLPAFYVAIITFHNEMIPTELLLFVASTRETVPLPAALELIIMDLTFELIREAGVRIPSVIGPSIGLVASLILGQAAVEAKIVSPLMVIVVALSGLASFAIPNYMANFGVRWLRFLLLAGAVVLGFYGIGALIFVLVIYVSGLRSFGMPYLAPVAPSDGRLSDIIIRPQVFNMELRPKYTRPLDRRRQVDPIRTWDKRSAKRLKQHAQKDEPDGGGSNS